MTLKRYLFDSSTQGKATITDLQEDSNGRPFVRLDQTLLHPQGGGQKADRGTINGIQVTHVAHDNGEVNHYVETLAGLQIGQEVAIAVDQEWRITNAQLHTAGHLIAALAEASFPTLKAESGHHWPGEARVEFAAPTPIDPDSVQTILTDELVKAIRNDLPVYVLGDPLVSRAIEISGFSAVPCGGTHLEHLNLLNEVRITQVKIKRGKLRVSYQTA